MKFNLLRLFGSALTEKFGPEERRGLPAHQGQILVIFVFALVALLGFTALAIDGGMIYADRRYSQSVADTAALAGAGAATQYIEDQAITWMAFTCTNPKVLTAVTEAYNAALVRASANQISTLDNDLSDNHGVEIICTNLPAQFEKSLEIHAVVTSTVNTSFLHFVYSGPVTNTVTSRVRIHPRTEEGFGNAIVSLSNQCGTNVGGIDFVGTSNVQITGGGVFSNSCLTASGNVTVTADTGINYITPGGVTLNGGATLTPMPGAPAPKPLVFKKDPPICPATATQSVQAGNGDNLTISPGNYSKIKMTGGKITMQAGLYCMTGDVDITGGELDGTAGVTIFSKPTSNNVQITGGPIIHINAPTDITQTAGSLVNVLIFLAEGNTGNVTMEGSSNSSYVGQVFAPNGSIDVGGNSAINPTFSTQLVGAYVKVHGTTNININYSASPKSTLAPLLDQTQ